MKLENNSRVSESLTKMLPNSSTRTCICGDLAESEFSSSYALFNYIVVICSMPMLAIFGLAGNIINIFIYTRKKYSPKRRTQHKNLFF